MAVDNAESGLGVMKRIRRRIRITSWVQILKIVVTLTVVAFLISVYVKGLQQNKFVRRARFNLKKLSKRRGTTYANKQHAFNDMQIQKTLRHTWPNNQQTEFTKDRTQFEQKAGTTGERERQPEFAKDRTEYEQTKGKQLKFANNRPQDEKKDGRTGEMDRQKVLTNDRQQDEQKGGQTGESENQKMLTNDRPQFEQKDGRTGEREKQKMSTNDRPQDEQKDGRNEERDRQKALTNDRPQDEQKDRRNEERDRQKALTNDRPQDEQKDGRNEERDRQKALTNDRPQDEQKAGKTEERDRQKVLTNDRPQDEQKDRRRGERDRQKVLKNDRQQFEQKFGQTGERDRQKMLSNDRPQDEQKVGRTRKRDRQKVLTNDRPQFEQKDGQTGKRERSTMLTKDRPQDEQKIGQTGEREKQNMFTNDRPQDVLKAGRTAEREKEKVLRKYQTQFDQKNRNTSHKLNQQGLNTSTLNNNITLKETERNTVLKVPRRGKVKTGINVVVVEEHHEVLPYWFGAAKKGMIPKSGNTLIHFDGHSDLSQPTYFPGYPFFKWPSTPQEVQYLMQSNDVFIQASAMAGLFRRVVWVWPTWDKKNHQEEHVITDLSLGWFRPKTEKYRLFCMCSRKSTDDFCRTFTPYGNHSYDKVKISTFDGFPVSPRNCTVLRSIVVEEISEKIAPAYFRRKKFMSENDSVLLDFDEDFFGCSYAVRPLLAANLSLRRIDQIDYAVAAIFCPRTLAQEHPTDDIMQVILKIIKNIKLCNNSTRNSSKICTAQLKRSQENIKTTAIQTIEDMAKKNLTRACVPARDKLKQLVKELVSIISNLTVKQINRLRMVGFCSETSPRTVVLDGERHFGVCKGLNGPNNTVVIEHSPTKTDIQTRSNLLNESLQALKPFSPRLATVCRSVRDGFTPRKHFEYIEKAIIKALNQTSSISVRIKYDKGLLGGKMGWPALHKI